MITIIIITTSGYEIPVHMMIAGQHKAGKPA
ncbi:hypothetical protein GXY_08080 [Novacetimonas hansenii ATCC 23769]|uniref:Uncharacterized protein n=1 Tax=Novacetimonas hansenii ATCC 23769 TaxID=714995 RepID=D5QEQ1_NOVHA|nr:hypothetical protein GXY_08080 [Novacetimonas hansenii ATCC 23769]